jgi:hypothetical protein
MRLVGFAQVTMRLTGMAGAGREFGRGMSTKVRQRVWRHSGVD